MNLSPQAQRRFRRTMTYAEMQDMASDLADYLGNAALVPAIYQLLLCYQTDREGER